jgi:hypothetical protein
MSYDPNQRFLSLIPGGNGIIYGIQSDGILYWYRHLGWANGTLTWSNSGTGRKIGIDWHQFRIVVAAADGQIFAVRPNGDLLWYRYILSNSTTGAGTWHAASGSRIGYGWNFPRVIGGWNNVLYAEDGEGNLYWYKYIGNDGSFRWATNSGSKIGSDWKQHNYLFADPNGVIYGLQSVSGSLTWYRYLGTTGSPTWANRGTGISLGWMGEYHHPQIFSNGSGTVYRVRLSQTNPPGPDGDLMWYRLRNSETINTSGISWYNNKVPIQVGRGFTSEWSAALQGYPSSLSIQPGDNVDIHVSTTFPSYTSSTVQLAPSAGGPVPVTPPVTRTGQFQLLQSGYHSNGCGWDPSFSVSAALTWPSGIYASQLKSPFGGEHNVMFTVRPTTPGLKDIAVVVPTNTYNAYNYWGGHNQYTSGQVGVQRTVTMQRPNMGLELTRTYVSQPGIRDRSLYADLLLLRWMTSAGFDFDCYTDSDLDADGDVWLPTYRVLVLLTHPEYFTQTARNNVVTFQSQARAPLGGRIIYAGGNGIYEKMEYTDGGQAIKFREPDGERDQFRYEVPPQPEQDIVGVGYYSPSYNSFARYRVLDDDHPFLAGTGLTEGSTFGAVGYSGPASGWEVDRKFDSDTAVTVIAEGLNTNGGAQMSYVRRNTWGQDGWVFSAGSLTFNGAVPYDAAIRRILQNVFTAATQNGFPVTALAERRGHAENLASRRAGGRRDCADCTEPSHHGRLREARAGGSVRAQ